MSIHLQREIEKLKKAVLSLCALVEEQSATAVRALLTRDDELAHRVEDRDVEVDDREIEVEEECLKILALHQPVAIDLRFIISCMKIDSDLERIGDLAANIARKAMTFAASPPMEIPFDLEGMWAKAQKMLQDAVDSLVNFDSALAMDVCARDDAVDRMKRDIRLRTEEMIRVEPERVAPLSTLQAASRNIERIADHATNIAEDVIYMVEGKIIRHGAG